MSAISRPRVPEGLRDVMKDLTREILKEKPTEIYEFAENYFQSRLPQKGNYTVKGFEPTTNKYDFSYIQNPQPYHVPVALVYSIIPEDLTNLIKDLIKAVLREQPENLCDFAVEYFRHLKTASRKEKAKEISYTAYENYFINKERFLFTPYVKCTCGRTFGEGFGTGYQLEQLNSLHRHHHNESIYKPETIHTTNEATNKTNVKDVLEKDTTYSEKYLNSIYVIQRYFRRYFKRKSTITKTNYSNSSNSNPTTTQSNFMNEETAAIIIQRTLRKVFGNRTETEKKIESSGEKTPIVPQLHLSQNENDNNSEASYTSASTALLSASESGRETSKLSTAENIFRNTILEGQEIVSDHENISDVLSQTNTVQGKDLTQINDDSKEIEKSLDITETKGSETIAPIVLNNEETEKLENKNAQSNIELNDHKIETNQNNDVPALDNLKMDNGNNINGSDKEFDEDKIKISTKEEHGNEVDDSTNKIISKKIKKHDNDHIKCIVHEKHIENILDDSSAELNFIENLPTEITKAKEDDTDIQINKLEQDQQASNEVRIKESLTNIEPNNQDLMDKLENGSTFNEPNKSILQGIEKEEEDNKIKFNEECNETLEAPNQKTLDDEMNKSLENKKNITKVYDDSKETPDKIKGEFKIDTLKDNQTTENFNETGIAEDTHLTVLDHKENNSMEMGDKLSTYEHKSEKHKDDTLKRVEGKEVDKNITIVKQDNRSINESSEDFIQSFNQMAKIQPEELMNENEHELTKNNIEVTTVDNESNKHESNDDQFTKETDNIPGNQEDINSIKSKPENQVKEEVIKKTESQKHEEKTELQNENDSTIVTHKHVENITGYQKSLPTSDDSGNEDIHKNFNEDEINDQNVKIDADVPTKVNKRSIIEYKNEKPISLQNLSEKSIDIESKDETETIEFEKDNSTIDDDLAKINDKESFTETDGQANSVTESTGDVNKTIDDSSLKYKSGIHKDDSNSESRVKENKNPEHEQKSNDPNNSPGETRNHDHKSLSDPKQQQEHKLTTNESIKDSIKIDSEQEEKESDIINDSTQFNEGLDEKSKTDIEHEKETTKPVEKGKENKLEQHEDVIEIEETQKDANNAEVVGENSLSNLNDNKNNLKVKEFAKDILEKEKQVNNDISKYVAASFSEAETKLDHIGESTVKDRDELDAQNPGYLDTKEKKTPTELDEQEEITTGKDLTEDEVAKPEKQHDGPMLNDLNTVFNSKEIQQGEKLQTQESNMHSSKSEKCDLNADKIDENDTQNIDATVNEGITANESKLAEREEQENILGSKTHKPLVELKTAEKGKETDESVMNDFNESTVLISEEEEDELEIQQTKLLSNSTVSEPNAGIDDKSDEPSETLMHDTNENPVSRNGEVKLETQESNKQLNKFIETNADKENAEDRHNSGSIINESKEQIVLKDDEFEQDAKIKINDTIAASQLNGTQTVSSSQELKKYENKTLQNSSEFSVGGEKIDTQDNESIVHESKDQTELNSEKLEQDDNMNVSNSNEASVYGVEKLDIQNNASNVNEPKEKNMSKSEECGPDDKQIKNTEKIPELNSDKMNKEEATEVNRDQEESVLVKQNEVISNSVLNKKTESEKDDISSLQKQNLLSDSKNELDANENTSHNLHNEIRNVPQSDTLSMVDFQVSEKVDTHNTKSIVNESKDPTISKSEEFKQEDTKMEISDNLFASKPNESTEIKKNIEECVSDNQNVVTLNTQKNVLSNDNQKQLDGIEYTTYGPDNEIKSDASTDKLTVNSSQGSIDLGTHSSKSTVNELKRKTESRSEELEQDDNKIEIKDKISESSLNSDNSKKINQSESNKDNEDNLQKYDLLQEKKLEINKDSTENVTPSEKLTNEYSENETTEKINYKSEHHVNNNPSETDDEISKTDAQEIKGEHKSDTKVQSSATICQELNAMSDFGKDDRDTIDNKTEIDSEMVVKPILLQDEIKFSEQNNEALDNERNSKEESSIINNSENSKEASKNSENDISKAMHKILSERLQVLKTENEGDILNKDNTENNISITKEDEIKSLNVNSHSEKDEYIESSNVNEATKEEINQESLKKIESEEEIIKDGTTNNDTNSHEKTGELKLLQQSRKESSDATSSHQDDEQTNEESSIPNRMKRFIDEENNPVHKLETENSENEEKGEIDKQSSKQNQTVDDTKIDFNRIPSTEEARNQENTNISTNVALVKNEVVTDQDNTLHNIGNKSPETIIGNQNLNIGRIRNYNEGLIGSFSGQRFAETHLKSFWKECRMNNETPIGQYVEFGEKEKVINNHKLKEEEKIGKDYKGPTNDLDQKLDEDNSYLSAESMVTTENSEESTMSAKNSNNYDILENVDNKNVTIDAANHSLKIIERIPRYFHGLTPITAKENLLAKRKICKESTAYTIPFDNSTDSKYIGKSSTERNTRTDYSNDEEQPLSKRDKINNLKKINLENCKNVEEHLLESETPTKLFKDLNEFEYDETHDIDLEITYTLDEILRLKTEHDSEQNSDENEDNNEADKIEYSPMIIRLTSENYVQQKSDETDENEVACSEFSETPESMLHTIIELSESETPRPDSKAMIPCAELLQLNDEEYLNNLEKNSDSTNTSWTTSSKDTEDNSFVSDEFLEDENYKMDNTSRKTENNHKTEGGIYEYVNGGDISKEDKFENNEYQNLIKLAPTPPNDDPYLEDLKESSAQKIQRCYREYLIKKREINPENDEYSNEIINAKETFIMAVCTIQRAFRNYQLRKNHKNALKDISHESGKIFKQSQNEKAAIVIQKVFRQYLEHKVKLKDETQANDMRADIIIEEGANINGKDYNSTHSDSTAQHKEYFDEIIKGQKTFITAVYTIQKAFRNYQLRKNLKHSENISNKSEHSVDESLNKFSNEQYLNRILNIHVSKGEEDIFSSRKDTNTTHVTFSKHVQAENDETTKTQKDFEINPTKSKQIADQSHNTAAAIIIQKAFRQYMDHKLQSKNEKDSNEDLNENSNAQEEIENAKEDVNQISKNKENYEMEYPNPNLLIKTKDNSIDNTDVVIEKFNQDDFISTDHNIEKFENLNDNETFAMQPQERSIIKNDKTMGNFPKMDCKSENFTDNSSQNEIITSEIHKEPMIVPHEHNNDNIIKYNNLIGEFINSEREYLDIINQKDLSNQLLKKIDFETSNINKVKKVLEEFLDSQKKESDSMTPSYEKIKESPTIEKTFPQDNYDNSSKNEKHKENDEVSSEVSSELVESVTIKKIAVNNDEFEIPNNSNILLNEMKDDSNESSEVIIEKFDQTEVNTKNRANGFKNFKANDELENLNIDNNQPDKTENELSKCVEKNTEKFNLEVVKNDIIFNKLTTNQNSHENIDNSCIKVENSFENCDSKRQASDIVETNNNLTQNLSNQTNLNNKSYELENLENIENKSNRLRSMGPSKELAALIIQKAFRSYLANNNKANKISYLNNETIHFEPTAPSEDDLNTSSTSSTLDSMNLNPLYEEKAATILQKAFRKFIEQKSKLNLITDATSAAITTKSNWFVGDEPILAKESLSRKSSEVSFDETEAYVELKDNPQYLVDSNSNLENSDATNRSRSPTAPVYSRSNSVDLNNDKQTNFSEEIVSVAGTGIKAIELMQKDQGNSDVSNEDIAGQLAHDDKLIKKFQKVSTPSANNEEPLVASHQRFLARNQNGKTIKYNNLIGQFINFERQYSDIVNQLNPTIKEIEFKTPDIYEITKILTEFLDSQHALNDASIPYEILEEPCIKRKVSKPLIETDLIDETMRDEDVSTESDIDNDTEDSLSTKTVKLCGPELAIEKMKQRRDSTTKVSSLDNSKEYNFEEPLVGPIDNLDTDEEGIVVNKLQREETRESSAQSDVDVIICGDNEETVNFFENIDLDSHFPAKGSLKRVHTIAGDVDAKSLLKNVTIDESIKYIEPPDYELNSGSLCLDDDTSENIRRKIMAYSLSEADSDYFDKTFQNRSNSGTDVKSQKYDDFNVSTALVDNGDTSTETESTIVSAVTKIQARARGYLTRKRLGRNSLTSDYKSLRQDDNSKASFGNAAISESLEHLVQDAAAKKIQNAYRKHYRKNFAHANQAYDSISPDLTTSMESSLAQKRSIMLQRGDALRNDSTPDEGNSSSNGSDTGKHRDEQKEKLKIPEENISLSGSNKSINEQQSKMDENHTLSEVKTSTAAIRAKKIEENKMRWLAMRQNSMPVQIDSEVLRVIPKHMRKKIKSADGEKKKGRRGVFKD